MRGRWYGIRGRRFVRPALILALEQGRSRRVLAELGDKPWAAEDGEPWRAEFRLDSELPAGPLELSVAPDITVSLRRNGGAAGAGTDSEPPARALAPVPAGPRATDAPSAPRAASGGRAGPRAAEARAPDAERLGARLTAADAALERERGRRVEAEAALEEQRARARQSTAETGRLRAELELAHAAEVQARDTAALLDATRRDHHATQTRFEALAVEHEAVLRDHAATRGQLDVRTGALRAAQDELTAERSHLSPPPRADRAVNPSLPSHSWLLRLIVLLVLAAALLAIYLVLHSTVLS